MAILSFDICFFFLRVICEAGKSLSNNKLYKFGGFELDAELLVLYRQGEVVALRPKALETLSVFVRSKGAVVLKDDLIEKVWPDTFVEENSLSRNVHELRKALSSLEAGDYVETIPRRGYRFIPEVTVSGGSDDDSPNDKTSTVDALGALAPSHRSPVRWHFITIVLLGVFLVSSFTIWWGFSSYGRLSDIPLNKRDFRSVAILPLNPLVEGEENEILSMGLSDQLISKIARLNLFAVRPLSSVRKYKDPERNVLEIGEELGVDAVLTGTFFRNNGRIKINMRLLDVRDGAQIWTRSFEEAEEDLIRLQEVVAIDVANSLVDVLTVDESRRLKKRATENPEAYKLYLEGKFFADKRSEKGLVKSIELFEQAYKLDPEFAEAYVGFADANWLRTEGMRGYSSPNELVPRIRAAIRRALELDPELASAYTTLADIQMYQDWDSRSAEKNFKKAIELDPNLDKAHHWYAWLLLAEGRIEEAKKEMETASQLNPTSLVIATEIGYPWFGDKDYKEAVSRFRSATRLDDTYLDAHIGLFRAFLELGDRSGMKTELEKIRELTASDATVYLYCLGRSQAFDGDLNAARKTLATLIRRRESGEYVSPVYLSVLSIDTIQEPEAFRWLKEGLEERNDFMPFLEITPEFEKIRNDPRFHEITRKLKAAG